jgi:hypothetical protein
MKPIILVIVSGAMLTLAMHQDTDDKNDDLTQSSNDHKLHVKGQEKKHDTEVLTNHVNYWLDRVQ